MIDLTISMLTQLFEILPQVFIIYICFDFLGSFFFGGR